MSFSEVQSLLGKGFYWARIDKRPYLSREESERLVQELKRVLAPAPSAGEAPTLAGSEDAAHAGPEG